MTDERMVYVGSLWHQHCDPFATVVAKSKKVALDVLKGQWDDEFSMMLDEIEHDHRIADDGYCHECDDFLVVDDIMTGGIFSEPLDSLFFSPDRQRELDDDGYTFLECQ